MNDVRKHNIALVLGWNGLGETAGLRRNSVGFDKIKELAEKASSDNPLVMNAFLYAFVCPAKNFDLFLRENIDEISGDITSIAGKMDALEAFERNATSLRDAALCETYLAARDVAARRSARDERRTLATLLFSGPSTAEQIAQDLGIGEGLAARILRALALVIEEKEAGAFTLRSDTGTLAVVLYLLRSTLGVRPVYVLQRRIAARKSEAAHGAT